MQAAFLIDGFNLYHSVCEAIKRTPQPPAPASAPLTVSASAPTGVGMAVTTSATLGSLASNLMPTPALPSLKWLNIRSLCESYLPLFGTAWGLHSIHYFSAFATHRQITDPTVVTRHEAYLKCLSDTQIITHMGHFKQKPYKCSSCGNLKFRHEEKETDTAIACQAFKLLKSGDVDKLIIMSGDTDFVPVVKMAKELYPTVTIDIVFPYMRTNAEYTGIADQTYKIKLNKYSQHQFPNPYICSDGTEITKPSSW